jgi:hypothetical protein
LFTRVVTDNSFALINAVLKTWNVKTLSEYLEWSYKFLKGTLKPGSREIIRVHVCCAHFMRIVANHKSECTPNKNQKMLAKFLIAVVALMVTAESLDAIIQIYRNLYVVLMSKTYSEHVTQSMARLLA